MANIKEQHPPETFKVVTAERFWAAVKSSRRNLHPTPRPYYTEWKDLNTHELWGWENKGWKNGGVKDEDNPTVYALRWP